VVIVTQQDQVFEPGLAAAGPVDEVVHLAAGRGPAAAARPGAVLIPEDDRAAQVVRDPLDLTGIYRLQTDKGINFMQWVSV